MKNKLILILIGIIVLGSFGVNWYSRAHWRFMANLIKVRSDGPNGKQNPWIAQVRAQYYF